MLENSRSPQALAQIRNSEKGSTNVAQVVDTSIFEAKVGSFHTPKRRSTGRASSKDEDSSDRASRLVAKRNLDFQEGTSFNNSFFFLLMISKLQIIFKILGFL